ncbi:MAG: trimeric intracellular cation channel family protein [Rhodospirillales bacterium]|nr:trimeric intracellular cation channel family protein [Rhodospirillales bacterium]
MNQFIQLLDLFGVAVFAASGALKASSKRMDVFGFVLIATVTGIGGGTLRDLLLGVRPVFWIGKPEYLAVCAATAILGFFIAHRLQHRQNWLLWADAVGLAIFCVLGAEVALAVGAPASVAVLMGLMTATFGGIIRDVLCAESPLILHREIYATAAAAGSLVYVLADWASVPPAAAMLTAFAVAFGARAAGILFGLSLPTYGGSR